MSDKLKALDISECMVGNKFKVVVYGDRELLKCESPLDRGRLANDVGLRAAKAVHDFFEDGGE